MNIQHKQYWSRMPGRFVNKLTGIEMPAGSFTGTVLEWYECFWESIVDVYKHLKIPPKEVIVRVNPRAGDILLTSCMLKKIEPDYFLFEFLDTSVKLYIDKRLKENCIYVCNKDKTIYGVVEILDIDFD